MIGLFRGLLRRGLWNEFRVKRLSLELWLRRGRFYFGLALLYEILSLFHLVLGSRRKSWFHHTAGMLLLILSGLSFSADFARRKVEDL